MLGELLRGLGVPPDGIPVSGFEREAMYRSVLAGRRVLVLADGASSADQVRPLLPGTAGSAVLVTSRARLADLDGAKLIELGGLLPADSVSLIARISGRRLAAEQAASARAIAAACGHLPLALRVAGARLAGDPDLTIADLAGLLADERRRLDELVVGEVSVRARLAAGLLHRVTGGGQSGDTSYLMHPLVRAYAAELLGRLPRSRRITSPVGERRTTARNPARSSRLREPKNMESS